MKKLELLQLQIAKIDGRLGTLYDAVETGEFNAGELVPRTNALFQKKDDLQRAKAEAEEAKELPVKEGYARACGARVLRRTIQQLVLDSLAGKVLEGEFEDGDTVILDAKIE